jgi:hypothetical protein
MILSFEKPKKVRSTEEHNKMYSSDCGVAGTFVPNMSKEDELKWKAKHIKGDDERVEIRKTLGGSNVLIIVYKNSYNPPYPDYPECGYNHPAYKDLYAKYQKEEKEWRKSHNEIQISTNGKIDMNFIDMVEVMKAITEAKMLMNITDPQNLGINNF